MKCLNKGSISNGPESDREEQTEPQYRYNMYSHCPICIGTRILVAHVTQGT